MSASPEKKKKGTDSEKERTTTRRKTGGTEAQDDSSPNPNSAMKSARGVPKAISAKGDPKSPQVVRPTRATDNGGPADGKDKDKRALPTGSKTGESKNHKTKKQMLKEKEIEQKKKDKKKKGRKAKRSVMDRILLSLGFAVGKVVLTDPRAVEAANSLRLRPWHLRKLKMKFDSIDIDGSGNIDADEFFEAIGEQRTPFTDKLFAMIDLDGSGTIEFDEFVRVLSTYCMFTQEDILRFCFECFDVDGSGSIDEREFIELCKTVNNAAPMFPQNFKAALEQFDVNEDGLIDYQEFLEIDRRFPMVLFPAFRLQDFMQKNTLGETAWLRIVEEYQAQKQLEEYKLQHGGRVPPDPILTKIGKIFLPCLYREREFIKLGYQ